MVQYDDDDRTALYGPDTYLHLGLDPGSDDVGLGGELAPQPLVGLLSGHLLLQHLVSEGHEVLHLQGAVESGGGFNTLRRRRM